MGSHDVRAPTSEAETRQFTRAVLADVQALDRMWREGLFETGHRRVGAEQELFLVGEGCRPAPVADRVLQRLEGPFTTELALYNLELNLPPLDLRPGFLDALEQALGGSVEQVRLAARAEGAEALMVGILPTLEPSDLTLANITPLPRYIGMNDALVRSRGTDFNVTIRGIDELETTNPSVMLESANTSFQLHLQVDPADFVRLYNLVQLLTAPLLAPAVNSPVLLGRRLWHETRIALFERSVDGRTPGERTRGLRTRVGFGTDWVHEGAVELFREDVARYRVLLMREVDGDPLLALDQGRLPSLRALALFNGTVWRWNRPCFGVDGVAHVRIENRVLPSGPTIRDAVSNAALFYGLVLGLDPLLGDVRDRMDFDDAHRNFLAVAQHGLSATLRWVDGRDVVARELLDELLSVADDGLASAGLGADERQRMLGPVAGRVATGQTGSQWILDALQELDALTPPARLRRVVETMLCNQLSGEPVHTWEPVRRLHTGAAPRRVRDVMSTDLYTVRPSDVVDLASYLMEWEAVRHVPVEDEHGAVVGLVDQQALLRAAGSAEPLAVRDVMDRVPCCCSPDLTLHEAAQQMLASPHGALLVIADGKLVGIVTDRDLIGALA